MGIAKLKPEADPNLRIHTTEVPRESYKGIVADNSNTPAVTLQAYIDGMPTPRTIAFRAKLSRER